jgi:hypothetical protein
MGFSLFPAAAAVAAMSAAPMPGCYVDQPDPDRQLPHQICLVTGGCATLSREWCGQQCQLAGFKLAGVEASHQCACGNKLRDPLAAAPIKSCNETCTGAKGETCGGKFRVFVFDAKSVGPPPVPPASPTEDPRWIPGEWFVECDIFWKRPLACFVFTVTLAR